VPYQACGGRKRAVQVIFCRISLYPLYCSHGTVWLAGLCKYVDRVLLRLTKLVVDANVQHRCARPKGVKLKVASGLRIVWYSNGNLSAQLGVCNACSWCVNRGRKRALQVRRLPHLFRDLGKAAWVQNMPWTGCRH
jgi:hypothetical protein